MLKDHDWFWCVGSDPLGPRAGQVWFGQFRLLGLGHLSLLSNMLVSHFVLCNIIISPIYSLWLGALSWALECRDSKVGKVLL